jgi:hypothetical protein
MSPAADLEREVAGGAVPRDFRSFLDLLAELPRNEDAGSGALLLLLLPPWSGGTSQKDLAGRLARSLGGGSGVRYEIGCLEGGRLGLLVWPAEEPDAVGFMLRQAREAAGVSMAGTGPGVGVALYPRDGRTGEALLEAASRSLWLFERLTRDVWSGPALFPAAAA